LNYFYILIFSFINSEMFSKNLPSIVGFTNVLLMKVILQKDFLFDTYESYINVDSIDISTIYFDTVVNSNIIQRLRPSLVRDLKLKLGMSTNNGLNKINLAINYPNLKAISIETNPTFSHNEFQFSSIPSNLQQFILKGSVFSGLDIALGLLRNVPFIDLSNNNIRAILPINNLNSFPNSELNISNNQISGVLDESYCKIANLDVSNNLLTGPIPKCFTCYMKNHFESRFSGNQFDNYFEMNNDCAYIQASLRIDGDKVYLEGSNLGFDPNTIKATPPLTFEMEIPSTRFVADFSKYLGIQTEFLISFTLINKNFKFNSPPKQPKVDFINTTPDGITSIYGSDFPNDKSKAIVTIGGNSCEVSISTFGFIECQMLNIRALTFGMLSYITISDPIYELKTQFYINYDSLTLLTTNVYYCNNGEGCNGYICDTLSQQPTCDCPGKQSNCMPYTCPNNCSDHGSCDESTGSCTCEKNYTSENDCSIFSMECPGNGCSGHGTCDHNTGLCTCDLNYTSENDCSVFSMDCPGNGCSGHGTCDHNNGECTCDENYTSTKDCSVFSMDCPGNGCSGHGTCDHSTGVCRCDLNYTSEKDCSVLYMECPGNGCSGHGICNHNTGECVCDINYTSEKDCSVLYIECPDKTCSSHGTCNTLKGECDCNEGFQGSDCSEIVIKNCPLYNGHICAGFGFCEDGFCKCDNSHQGDDCSVVYVECPKNNGQICSGGLNKCNNITGVCTCEPNKSGYDCSVDDSIYCKDPTCNNNGICDKSKGKCNCNDGYSGDSCETPICSSSCSNHGSYPTCSNHGVCDRSKGICSCNNGFGGESCETPICSTGCSNHGSCISPGKCKCLDGWIGDDCSIAHIECSPVCGVNGKCDNTKGTCDCNNGYSGESCDLPICSTNCSNQGSCVAPEKCQCISDFVGIDCSISAKKTHFISSIEPCSILGGEVTIYGWFGTVHEKLTVQIGDMFCEDLVATETTIKCTLMGGMGTKDVIITQNYVSSFGKFQYFNPIQSCPNNCTSPENGQCDTTTGQCSCSIKNDGFDCSLEKVSTEKDYPASITKINLETGSASISNQDTNYEVSIISLIEFDINSNIVSTNYFKKHWDSSIDEEKAIYQFSQKLDNNNGIITYIVEEVKQNKVYEFAGMKLSLEEGGIKVSVNISNYEYQSSLNTLQLRFLSASGENSNTTLSNKCNQNPSKSDTSNVDPNQALNYISITKNSKQFSGRFINKVISDGRSTFMTSEIIKDLTNSSTVTVGLNLPHCNQFCFIDPDFSVLVSSNFNPNCEGVSKNNWVIPVAVVVPVVSLSILVLASVLVYRKHRYAIRLFFLKRSTNSSFKLKEKRNKYHY
ncbi:hypothetical protein DICPUDRAFT_38006, partial [Dictyostelium purpureum]